MKLLYDVTPYQWKYCQINIIFQNSRHSPSRSMLRMIINTNLKWLKHQNEVLVTNSYFTTILKLVKLQSRFNSRGTW